MALSPYLQYIYPKSIRLAKSSVAQGQALQSHLNLFQLLVEILKSTNEVGGFGFDEIFTELYTIDQVRLIAPQVSSVTEILFRWQANTSKQSVSNLSKCIAAVYLSEAVPVQAKKLIAVRFVNDIESPVDTIRQLALLCLVSSSALSLEPV